MNPNTKTLVGALVAAALAIAVYYGLISQQSASSIQTQANQTLGTPPGTQQPTSADAQNPMTPTPTAPATPTPGQPGPQNAAPAPVH